MHHIIKFHKVPELIQAGTSRGVARRVRGEGCGPHQAALARGRQISENCKKKIHVKFQIVLSFICMRVQ